VGKPKNILIVGLKICRLRTSSGNGPHLGAAINIDPAGGSAMVRAMSSRIRKLIGTIIILIFLIFYALIVAAVADPILRNASKFGEFLFYLITGLAWIVPAGIVIKWMQRPR
jgi:hypothetical protein